MLDLHAVFEEFEHEFLKFDRIENPRHPRRDLCAFLMLDDLLGGKGCMVSGAEHDLIYLESRCLLLARKASKEFIRDLVRCGISHDEEGDYLVKHV